jgi:hypothetical protein
MPVKRAHWPRYLAAATAVAALLLIVRHDASSSGADADSGDATSCQGANPPAPSLRAARVSSQTVDVSWSFAALPDDCRPVAVLLSLRAPGVGPAYSKKVSVNRSSGSERLTFPVVGSMPDKALASAFTKSGLRSQVVQISIAR